MSDRPPKRSALELVKSIGHDSTEAFLAHPKPDDFFKFEIMAFPEFYTLEEQKDLSLASKRETFDARKNKDDTFVYAYELTYRRHYEIEDSWVAMVADPDFVQYQVEAAPISEPLSLESMEFVMLAIADDDFYVQERQHYNLFSPLVCNWLIDWRAQFGHHVATDDAWRSSITKSTWRALRKRIEVFAGVIAEAMLPRRQDIITREGRAMDAFLRERYHVVTDSFDEQRLEWLFEHVWKAAIVAKHPVLKNSFRIPFRNSNV